MLLQWCLKGIPETLHFGDVQANNILSGGLPSMWIINNKSLALDPGIKDAQMALSNSALDDHVNNYSAVCRTTPYISLSAGSVVPSISGGVSVRPAWKTALDFATQGGKSAGYVFRCWTIVSPKSSAALLNISDEVRELNVFRQFWIFHNEGEVAAKLFVPRCQIEWFKKYDAQSDLVLSQKNRAFIDPNDICNLVEAVA